MCQEVITYKEQHNNDFSNYFDLKKIDKDAEQLLQQFYENVDNELSQEENFTDIIRIAKIMGFKIYETELKGKNRNLSGMIGISERFNDVYNNDKVIILNSINSQEHRLFTVAHEIAHYIYDYQEGQNEFFNGYNTEEAQTDEEIRANRFAAAIMMPATKFMKNFNNKISIEKNIKELSKIFTMPKTAIKQRMIELGLI